MVDSIDGPLGADRDFGCPICNEAVDSCRAVFPCLHSFDPCNRRGVVGNDCPEDFFLFGHFD